MKHIFWIWSMVLVAIPSTVIATVEISEIAWMGTTESHFCNWIELQNVGDSEVDIAEWSIQIGDTVREFSSGEAVSTVIPAQSYYVIKRTTNTCPDPLPEVSGLILALGNLPNSGTTLRLRRPDGSDADVVVGGEEWQLVGGDNTTKDTAQKTSDGWITAPPTPGQPPATTTPTVSEEEQQPSAAETSGGHRFVSARSVRTNMELSDDSELQITITGPEIIQSGQEAVFTVTPEGVGSGIKNSLRYSWNFGDFYTATEQVPVHIFNHPGVYLVTVEAYYESRTARTYHEVVVVPAKLSMSFTEDGELLLHNDTEYDLNLSGFRLVGLVDLEVPAETYVLARQTVRVPVELYDRREPTLVMMYDRSGAVVASQKTIYEDVVETEVDDDIAIQPVASIQNQPVQSSNTSFFPNVTSAQTEGSEEIFITDDEHEESAPESEPVQDRTDVQWFDIFMYIVLALLLVVAAGLLLPKKSNTT